MRRRTYKRPSVFQSWNVRRIVRQYVPPALAGIASGVILAAPFAAAILSA